MPSGRVHAVLTGIGAVLAAGTAWAVGGTTQQVVEVGLGTLAGLALTPDLDVDGGCFAFYAVRWAFGRPASWLWRVIWWPYARWVPHRSAWSHSLYATFFRLAYLGLPIRLALWLGWGWSFWPTHWWWLFIVGLWWSDFLHVYADIFVSEANRRIRRRR